MLGSLSRLWEFRQPPPSGAQALTVEAFLPLPGGSLDAEAAIGSLAFPRDQYHGLRGLLIEMDAADETRGLLESLKALTAAPVKTLILLRRGRESTCAKREAGFLAPYVAVHWNPAEENAGERLRAVLKDVRRWMRGDRTELYPSRPLSAQVKPAVVAGSVPAPANPLASMFKERAVLNFSEEVMKHRRQGPMMP